MLEIGGGLSVRENLMEKLKGLREREREREWGHFYGTKGFEIRMQ